MYQILRRAGGSLVMTIPQAFVEQNNLPEGSQVKLTLLGSKMTVITPQKLRNNLEELMREMTDGLPMVEGWDERPAVGQKMP